MEKASTVVAGLVYREERRFADSYSGMFTVQFFQITEGTFDDWGFRHGKVEGHDGEFVVGDSIVVDRMTHVGRGI